MKNYINKGLVFVCLLAACNPKADEGSITRNREQTVRLSSQESEHRELFDNGSIKSHYFTRDGKLNGLYVNYYPNGRISDSGNWVQGVKDGLFAYLDSSGNFEKIVEFVPFRDTNASRPNQIFIIGNRGDTMLNRKSLFYDFWYIKDTIRYDDEEYVFKMVLRGHIYDSAYLRVCDFNEKYELVDKGKCHTVKMNNFEVVVALPKERYNIGENTLRGSIVNFQRFKTPDGRDTMNTVEIFFKRKFFVLK